MHRTIWLNHHAPYYLVKLDPPQTIQRSLVKWALAHFGYTIVAFMVYN